MSLTIKYLDNPEGAQEAGTVTGTGLQPFSDTTSMASGAEDIAWATLESGLWVLDGTREILPDEPEGVGWWSEKTSAWEPFILGKSILGRNPIGNGAEPGTFTEPPTIVIDFSDRFSANGITLTFSPSTEQWCSEINVQWYRGDALLSELRAYPESAQWSGGDTVEGFDRIIIELIKTNQPGHFAKVQQIIVGQTVVFERSEIVRVQLINEVDQTLGTLPVDTSLIEVHSRSGRELNPQKNQRMEIHKDGKLLAAHYIENGSREAKNYYTFSCQSAVGMLEDDYLGGVYVDAPVEDLVSDILNGWRYEIADSLKSMTVSGYLPVLTRREALQQVAFAIGAMVTTYGTDKIRLIPLPESTDGEFTGSDIFMGAKLTTSPRIARYEVTAHHYTASKTEETLLEDEQIDGEDLLITFDSPHYDYAITGGTITGSGANWITVTASGAVTVTAKAYTHTTTVRTKRNALATHTERSNVMSVTEATLVNNGNVQAVLDRLYEAGRRRQTLTQEVVVTDQKAGMIVLSENPWDAKTRGVITSMEHDLTQNGHTAAVTIIGVEAGSSDDLGGIVYAYSGEIYSGSEVLW